MLFQCSAPHSTAAAPAPCPEGALDFSVSVTSCLLSGRLLLGKWTGQPKMATLEFYESSLSKIYPSSHWLGCNSSVVLGKRLFHSTEHDCMGSRDPPTKGRMEHSTAQHIPQYKAPLPWRFLHNPYHVGDSLFPDKGSRYHEQTNTL